MGWVGSSGASRKGSMLKKFALKAAAILVSGFLGKVEDQGGRKQWQFRCDG